MRTIAVVNQKGGVGKTFTSVNLAIGLAREGKKVLLIDLDPQGSATISLGYQDPYEIRVTISNILNNIINGQAVEHNFGILKHEENIEFIPANGVLNNVEFELYNLFKENTDKRMKVLKKYIDNIKEKYEIVIIDCPPTLGLLTINALTCSNEVLIPIQPQLLSIKGMELLFQSIANTKRSLNKELSITGILITMADMRTNFTKDIIRLVNETYANKLRVFKSVVPLSVRASETSAEGISIFKHDPKGKVANVYQNLVAEVMSDEK